MKKTATPYADTGVSIEKSRHDISGLLARRGVGGVQWTTWPDGKSVLRFEFEADGRTYMARLHIDPKGQGRPFKWSYRARTNRQTQEEKHREQEARRLHRTLYWYVKSKLEAIEAGLETPTQAWLAAIEGPRGHTIFQELEHGLRSMVAGDFTSVPALPPAPEER